MALEALYYTEGSGAVRRSSFSSWSAERQEAKALDERFQAASELIICARKLAYWSRYITTEVGIRQMERNCSALRGNWSV